jgi:protein-disulfide isomerase
MQISGIRHIFVIAILVLLAPLSSSAPSAQTKPSGRALGPVTAKVRIDLFSDFQCPACKGLAEGALKRVKDDYARTGKIRFVHHDFPLPQHQYAKRAATLASAADQLGKFEQVSEVLFREQPTWSVTGKVDDVVDSVLTPEERKKIRQLAADPAIAAAIAKDVELGQRTGVSSTPTMIITANGKPPSPVVGGVSYAVLSKYLDSLLAQ